MDILEYFSAWNLPQNCRIWTEKDAAVSTAYHELW